PATPAAARIEKRMRERGRRIVTSLSEDESKGPTEGGYECPWKMLRRAHPQGLIANSACRIAGIRGRVTPSNDVVHLDRLQEDLPSLGSGARGGDPAPRRLDGGNVDLPHRHHRLERALRLVAAGRKRVGQRPRCDLPGQAPADLAPCSSHLLGGHGGRSGSITVPSLSDRPSRSGRRRPRCAGTSDRRSSRDREYPER